MNNTPKFFRVEIESAMSAQIMGNHNREAFVESPCTRIGPVDVMVEGSTWGRTMRALGGLIICSVGFAAEMIRAGVRIGRGECFPVNINMISGKARRSAASEYCWLRPLRELGVEIVSLTSLEKRLPISPVTVSSHIFGAKDTTAFLYCNLEFLEIARANRWDDFRFLPMDVPLGYFEPWSIDYLGEAWPPQWYPEGMQAHPSNLGKDP